MGEPSPPHLLPLCLFFAFVLPVSRSKRNWNCLDNLDGGKVLNVVENLQAFNAGHNRSVSAVRRQKASYVRSLIGSCVCKETASFTTFFLQGPTGQNKGVLFWQVKPANL